MKLDPRVRYLRERAKRGGAFTMSGVTRDATSNVYSPASAAEWTTTRSVAGITSGNPFSMWLLQEASGALADSIGTAPLTNSGGMAYQQAVTGWTRVSMLASDLNGAYSLANAADTALPDLSAESSLVLGYLKITGAPGGDRGVILTGDIRAEVTSGNVPKLVHGATTATGSGNVTTAVRPWVLRYDRAASTIALFTDLEKVSIAFANSGSTKRIFYGAGFQNAPGFQILYGAHWKGAAAELSDASVRSLLQALGWTVAW
jgi:hypothetical protein